MTAPGVGAALSVLRPDDVEMALLRACLGTGTPAREGWRRWRAGQTGSEAGVCEALSRWRTLLPLLARSAARNDLDVGESVRSYLRATCLREELRAERYGRIVSPALAELERSGVEVFAVRGAALAASVYEPRWLRHCHDLDLLVRRSALGDAASALGRAGFVRQGGRTASRGDAIAEHASGLQVAVHTRPFAVPYHEVSFDAFTREAGEVVIGDVRVRTPSIETTLVHVLGHATYSASRRNGRWVADAWHVLARHPDLRWDEVTAQLAAHRLELPVCVLLDCLADLGAAVPDGVRAHVRRRAEAADRVAEDVALGGLASATGGDVVGLWRSTPSWRGRLRLARWALAPSPGYVRSTFGEPARWQMPAWYLFRPARFVAERLARRLRPAAPRPASWSA